MSLGAAGGSGAGGESPRFDGAGSDVPEAEFVATMLAIFVIEYLFLVAWDVPRA
jgi:hypothetical protein